MLINILPSSSPEKQKKGILWLYAFSSVDRILTENFSFWTCALLRIAIHLQSLLLSKDISILFCYPPYELSKLLRTINESKTIPPHPKIAACPYHQNKPRIACIIAPAQKTSFSEKYCTLVQTSAEKTYAIQNENQKTLSLLHCLKAAGCSNLAKNHPPSVRR